MKISTNNIGNYSPKVRTNADYRNVSTEKQNQSLKVKNQILENPAITKEEKKFFAGLYPQNQTEIIDYHFYQKSGQMSGVKIGSQIDRRG